MLMLKAKYASNDGNDGTTEFFPLDQILNISKRKNGKVKILMGAGLCWDVYPDSLEIVEITPENIRSTIGGGEK